MSIKSLGLVYWKAPIKKAYTTKFVRTASIIKKEKAMPLIFEEVKLECGYRIDLVVENKLVIETKSVDTLNDIHLAQTLTYLKLGKYKLGLLINFNVVLLKEGIKRIINGQLSK